MVQKGNADESQARKKSSKKGSTTATSTDSYGLSTIGHSADVLDMPVDPNEPTYCLCHQVSYGEMIGCDNPDVSTEKREHLKNSSSIFNCFHFLFFFLKCPIEWFHFACVGLTTKPKGKWFCPNCSADRKKK